MQLLQKLFRPSAGKTIRMREGVVATAMGGRALPDLFFEDLRCIRLHTFTEGKSEVLASGDMVQSYYKTLDDKEYGVFDTMYIRLIGNSVNVIFKSSKPAEAGIPGMRRLINDLFAIYGVDSSNKGSFEPSDAVEYADKHFYVLFGRDWMDYPKYPFPVTIRRYAEEVFISIWGLSRDHITD